ncbi:MAG: hypothetical protein GWN00_29895 [Aliifodinibius sp.]|nr:trypsin-like peptidase domain-containing protein [Fodinibius sp.]NIY28851.1 hypothetical protein [Fodinibius sp.]
MAVLLAEGFIPDDVIALDFDKYVTVKGGEEITSIGFPQMGAIPWAVTSGTIVGRQGRYITFTGAVDEGNSGGPLIKDGIVVGIITDILGLFNYAQPTATVQSALSGWRVRFSDKSDKRLLQGALDRFKHEQRLIVPLSEEQSSTLQRILKEYGEYWGQIYLGLIANDVGLIDTGIEASFEYIYLVLDITAQVWAGQNLNDRMLNKPAGDALKELVKIMLDEAGGTAHLDDQAISRIRQRVLKNKDIYIRDEFGRGGPRLRPIK